MINLDSYGLHWVEGNIGLLVQQDTVDHVLGIPMSFPVTVKPMRQRLYCPHNINLYDAEEGELPDDPLVQAMLPLPREFGSPVPFVVDNQENRQYVKDLLRLSSSEQMVSFWAARPDYMGPQLSITNLAPFVLFGYSEPQIQWYHQLIQMGYYSTRRLILVGPENAVLRSQVQRIKFKPEAIGHLPLERIGAWHLKQRMLGNVNRSRNESASEPTKNQG